MWYDKLLQVWKIKDLRKSILQVLGILVIFRFIAHIPIPGINTAALSDFFNSNQILGLMNVFSGGAMEKFSVIMLGVGPYITASIILQLLTMVIPRLEQIMKEGEQGRQKINQWTRMLTVPLAAFQAYSMIIVLRQSNMNIISDMSLLKLISVIATITAGTVFLMWLGELISEKHVGNGISLIIFAGIVSEIPSTISRVIATYDPTQLINIASFLLVAIVTVAGVVYITEAQRNIPVSYARQIRGMRMYGGVDTHLPLRVNQAGMIPIIFAISIVLFPTMIAQFFLGAKTEFIKAAAQWIIDLFQNQLFYGIIYFLLVVFFTYFYTEVIFHPKQIAENLQKQGGFIPGIRPGNNTSDYLSNVSHRIVLVGALFLGLLAVLPLILRQFTGMDNLSISGASLLIVVSVVIETNKQIESQLLMRDYENL